MEEDEISELVGQRLTNAAKASRLAKGIGIPLFAALAGGAQFFEFYPGEPSGYQIFGIVATAVVFVFGIYIGFADENAPQELERARRALDLSRRDDDEQYRRAYEAELAIEDKRRAGALYLAMHRMRGALERLEPVDGVIEGAVPKALLTAASQELPIALGFETSHEWTLGIYRAENAATPGRKQLRLVAHKRAIDCEISEARVWPEGIGIMGTAFVNKRDIIIPDANEPTLRSIFARHDQLARPIDEERYVSFAAIPVLVGGDDTPWGAVIATNNQPHHFSTDSAHGVQTAEAVRAVAGMVALGVSISKRLHPGEADSQGSQQGGMS